MEEEQHKGAALVVLGITAVIAVVGLVLMFSGANKVSGAIPTSATGGQIICPQSTMVGERQWFPVLAGPYENGRYLGDWENAGFECVPSPSAQGIDEYGFADVYCCRNPVGVPVNERGPTPLETRQFSGVPVGSGNLQVASGQYNSPRVGP